MEWEYIADTAQNVVQELGYVAWNVSAFCLNTLIGLPTLLPQFWQTWRPRSLKDYIHACIIGMTFTLAFNNVGIVLSMRARVPTRITVVTPFRLSKTAVAERTELQSLRHEVSRLETLIHDLEGLVSLQALGGVAKKDFALYTSGGSTIPHLSSPSRISPDESWWNIALSSLNSQEQTCASRYPWPGGPNMAIHHIISPGYCWPFSGTRGHLGIRLSQTIRPDSVTIDHAAAEIAPDRSCAPRRMSLWGLVEGVDDLKRAKTWEEHRRTLSLQKHPALEMEGVPPHVQTILTSAKWLPLAKFEYDMHSPNNIQTFPVHGDLRTLQVGFRTVMLLIESNWGNDAYTCMYRVRVHGTS